MKFLKFCFVKEEFFLESVVCASKLNYSLLYAANYIDKLSACNVPTPPVVKKYYLPMRRSVNELNARGAG